MQDEKLSLDEAVNEANSSELVKHHHDILQGDDKDGKINCIRKYKGRNKVKSSENLKRDDRSPEVGKSRCDRCGKSPSHKLEVCLAINAGCLKCKKQGHFAAVCKSKNIHSFAQHDDSTLPSSDDYFLGEINDDENKENWSVNLSLGEARLRFKIDTGADVTVIEGCLCAKWTSSTWSTPKNLFGPGQEKLSVIGVVKRVLKISNLKETLQDIYVIGNLKEPLLGRKVGAIQADESSNIEDKVKSTYPNLFKGLGELDGEFSIKLNLGSTPFALTTARRVVIPLLNKVEAKLKRMEKFGVISKVDIHTDWCAGMVVVPKPDGNIRICVDLTKLNDSVRRETVSLPKIDNVLAQDSVRKDLTPFGKFCFNRMPFGIKSAPEHYQKKMSQILDGLEGHISLIDDILVDGKTH